MIAQDCLTGYVGIPGCSASDPESGLWITDHPGLPLTSFDKIADSDKQTWKAVWDVIQKRAIDRLANDVVSSFARKYRIRKLRENFKFPEDVDTVNNQTAAAGAGGEFRGWTIEFNENSDYAYSSLLIVHFQQIKFYAKNAANEVTFWIRDEITGEILETKTVNLTQGWNTIWTNLHFSRFHLSVSYNAATLESVYLELPSGTNLSGSCDCCHFCLSGCDAVIRGAIVGGATGMNTYGFAGTISVNCSYEKVICENKFMFRQALWHLLAVEALRERIFSERLNRFTTIDRKIAKEEMLPEQNALYLDALNQATDGIDLNDSCCLECDSVVHYQTVSL